MRLFLSGGSLRLLWAKVGQDCKVLAAVAAALLLGTLATSTSVFAVPEGCTVMNCSDVVNITYEITCPTGGNCETVFWTTTSETNLLGFNVLVLDPDTSTFTQVNTNLIRCKFCTTGQGELYAFSGVPKSSPCIYIEAVYQTSSTETCGPAVKR